MLKADEIKVIFTGPAKVCILLALAALCALVIVSAGAVSKSAPVEKRKELVRIRKDVKAIHALRAVTASVISETEIRDVKNFVAFLEQVAKTVGFRSRLKRIAPKRESVDAKTERAIFNITLPDVSLKEAVAFMYEIQVKKPYVSITKVRLNTYSQSQLVGLWSGTVALEFYAPRKGAATPAPG